MRPQGKDGASANYWYKGAMVLLRSSAAEVSQNDLAGEAADRMRWLHLLATFVILLVFSWLGIVLSRQSEGVATIWFTNGLLFAVVITQPRRTWVYYFVAGFLADTAADVIYGDPFRLSAGVAVANSLEVITSTLVLTRWFGRPFQLTKRFPLLGFLGVAVLGATALTSALGASWTLLFVHAGPWWMLFRTWYLGDILGMAIIAPLVFILQRPGFFTMLQRNQLPATILLLMVPAIATALVFTDSSDPLIFFIFPALLLVVFRLGFPGTVLAIFVIALISLSFTIAGEGPLMLTRNSHVLHRVVIEQIFLAVALFTSFPVAALLEDRKALEISLQESEQRYRELANADSLTGLANRRAFDERLEQEWTEAAKRRMLLALLVIDVDMFKSYNDVYGHIGGDQCLRAIAGAILEATPCGSAMAARIGGEEFGVILPHTGLDEALRIGEDIRRTVASNGLPNSASSQGIQTVSVGVAGWVPEGNSLATSLMAAADHALYRAKYLGRDRVESASSPAPQPVLSAGPKRDPVFEDMT
ncbi:MAG: diguanylate cyclase [Acidobacteriota bacterium]|nr:diguanylate cyclase [Acidobacteriota bacterium]